MVQNMVYIGKTYVKHCFVMKHHFRAPKSIRMVPSESENPTSPLGLGGLAWGIGGYVCVYLVFNPLGRGLPLPLPPLPGPGPPGRAGS